MKLIASTEIAYIIKSYNSSIWKIAKKYNVKSSIYRYNERKKKYSVLPLGAADLLYDGGTFWNIDTLYF